MRTLSLPRFAVLVVCILLRTLALGQTKAVTNVSPAGNRRAGRPTAASASVEHLKDQLYASVSAAPWPVTEQLIYLALKEHSGDALYRPGIQDLPTRTTFLNPTEVSDYVERLRTESIRLSTEELEQSGVPQKVAQRISENMARPHLDALREVLLKYAQASENLAPKKVAATLQSAVQGSMSGLLNKPSKEQLVGISSLLHKNAVTRTMFLKENGGLTLAAWPSRGDADPDGPDNVVPNSSIIQKRAKDINGLEAAVLNCLTPQARNAYLALNVAKDPDARAHALDTLANGLAAKAEGVVTAPIPNALHNLSAEKSLQVLAAVGQLNEVQQTAMRALTDGGKQLVTGLDTAGSVFRTQWDKEYQAAFRAKGSLVPEIPPQVDTDLAKTAYLFSRLQTISKGQVPVDAIAEITNLLPNNSPQIKQLEGIVVGVRSITSANSNYAATGEAVLNTLETVAGGAIPQLKQIHSAFSAISPLLQAAGPLMALAGCTTPIGMLQLAGGLFGGGGPFGGGGNDAAMEAIKQQLAVINAKLDEVLDRLKKLDQEIKEQHVEVMNALEAISFDVRRVHDLVLQGKIWDASKDCEGWQESLQSGDFPQAEARYTSCIDSLNNSVFEGQHPPEFLKAISNLKTESLKQSAYDKLIKIVEVHEQSMADAKGNCFSLVLGGNLISDIESVRGIGEDQAEQDRAASQNTTAETQQRAATEASLCQKVLAVDDMLDASVLSFFVDLDLRTTAIVASNRAAESEERKLWAKNSLADDLGRWRKELSYLNVAIGQQALLAGDATAPAWADKLESDIGAADASVLDGQQILAQNAVRYWIGRHVKGPRSQAEYAFAYYACDPAFLSFASNLTSQQVSFNWTNLVEDHVNDKNASDLCPNAKTSSDKRASRWCAQFKNLKGCIDLPTPTEKVTSEIRRSSNLEMLVALRGAVLERIETARLSQQQSPEERMRLFEAVAINWKAKQQNATAPKRTAAATNSRHS